MVVEESDAAGGAEHGGDPDIVSSLAGGYGGVERAFCGSGHHSLQWGELGIGLDCGLDRGGQAAGARAAVGFRSALADPETGALLAGSLQQELLGPVAQVVAGRDKPELRAARASSQIAGMIVTRYLLRLPAIASTPVDVLACEIGTNVQRYLFEPLAAT